MITTAARTAAAATASIAGRWRAPPIRCPGGVVKGLSMVDWRRIQGGDGPDGPRRQRTAPESPHRIAHMFGYRTAAGRGRRRCRTPVFMVCSRASSLDLGGPQGVPAAVPGFADAFRETVESAFPARRKRGLRRMSRLRITIGLAVAVCAMFALASPAFAKEKLVFGEFQGSVTGKNAETEALPVQQLAEDRESEVTDCSSETTNLTKNCPKTVKRNWKNPARSPWRSRAHSGRNRARATKATASA